MFERLFNTTPKQELEAGKPVMYKDRENSFSSTLLCGMDFDLLMLDALLISLINTLFYQQKSVKSTVILGILIAYIVG